MSLAIPILTARISRYPLTECLRVSAAEERFAIGVDVVNRIIFLRGELDVATVGPLSDAVMVLTRGGISSMSIDFTEVSFVDAAGLGTVAAISNVVSDSDASLTLRGVSPKVARVFHLGGLQMLLPEDTRA